jgi:nucleoside-diphosphate-sugar epimerase
MAHGASPGVSGGGPGPLIFILAFILFVLYLVYDRRRKGWSVLVTGGAGYVGSALVPKLLERGHRVTVLDLYLYGEEVLDGVRGHVNLRQVKGDIRDMRAVEKALEGCDAFIHLAYISDEASYDLDPGLGKSVNFDAFRPLVRAAKKAGVKRFIYASSQSVYGVTDGSDATEESSLEPAGGFSRDKALCEDVLARERAPGFVTCTVRPSAVCGYAPRQRFDVMVNDLAGQALGQGRIRVAGGSQACPVIPIDDMVEMYLFLLGQPDARIDGKTYNAVSENPTLLELADVVKGVVVGDLAIDTGSAGEPRSRPLSPERMRHELGFRPDHTVADAVGDLAAAFRDGKLPGSLDDPRYFNVETMRRAGLD